MGELIRPLVSVHRLVLLLSLLLEGSYQLSHIYDNLFAPNLSGERRLDRSEEGFSRDRNVNIYLKKVVLMVNEFHYLGLGLLFTLAILCISTILDVEKCPYARMSVIRGCSQEFGEAPKTRKIMMKI